MTDERKKYYAIAKRSDNPTPRPLRFLSVNDKTAVDDMYGYLGAKKASDVADYVLYEILDNDHMRLVGEKVGNKTPLLEHKQVEKHTFTEKVYKSYKDAA